MLDYSLSNKFKKDLKRLEDRGVDISEVKIVIKKIVNKERLDKSYRNHVLEPKSQKPKRWELHLGGIASDLIMIYFYREKNTVIFDRIGTHSDLFK